MRCKDARKHLPDYLTGNMGPALELPLRAHLEACEACRTEFEELEALWNDMNSHAVPDRDRSRMRAGIRLLETYPDEIRYEFRHFPLPLHENAMPAAKAAEAAGLQGRFWEKRAASSVSRRAGCG